MRMQAKHVGFFVLTFAAVPVWAQGGQPYPQPDPAAGSTLRLHPHPDPTRYALLPPEMEAGTR